jgi:hypothetical protein
MPNRLTNLLPSGHVRSVRRQYFMRLATVGMLMLALLIAMQAILLVPTYLYARTQVAQNTATLAASGEGGSVEEQEFQTRSQELARISGDLAGLTQLPSASNAIRSVLAVPHPGVALSGFTFSAPKGEAPARLDVSGIAASRDTLRQYAAALSALPFVTNADLPISAYAKERDISFTITLSGSLMP